MGVYKDRLIDTIAKANLKIFHGKYGDCVPVSHSLGLYNVLTERYPQASVYLDIFDGGHDMDLRTAEYWLLSQYKKKKKTAVTG